MKVLDAFDVPWQHWLRRESRGVGAAGLQFLVDYRQRCLEQRAECNELDGPMHSTLALLCRDLLIASLGQFLRNCRQITEQARGFLVWAGGEVDLR